MTSALAWPVMTGAVLLMFRRELRLWLSERPTSLKVGPFAAQWGRNASRVAADLVRSGAPLATEPNAAESLADLLADSPGPPVAPISDALGVITERLRGGLADAGIPAAEHEELRGLVRLGAQNGVLDQATADALMGLSVMGNLALSRPAAVADSEVREFLALADSSLFALNMSLRRRGKDN